MKKPQPPNPTQIAADVLVEVVKATWPSELGSGYLVLARGLAMHLQRMKIAPLVLQSDDGRAALEAIALASDRQELRALAFSNANVLSMRWAKVLQAAWSQLPAPNSEDRRRLTNDKPPRSQWTGVKIFKWTQP